MMSDLILLTDQAGVRHIQINRPQKKNALLGEMYAALSAALEEASTDDAIRAVVISGSGGNFTAGNDIGDFLQNPPRDPSSPVLAFLGSLPAFPKPLVAGVQGVAVGIGTTLLLHCDLVYAGESARFMLPFVNLGLVPEAGSSLLLPQMAGHQRAAELLLLGEMFGPHKAVEVGIVNQVMPDDKVIEHSLKMAATLAAKPPSAVRLTKALLKRANGVALTETMAVEMDSFRKCLTSPEAQEAFQAFLERRPPDFSQFV